MPKFPSFFAALRSRLFLSQQNPARHRRLLFDRFEDRRMLALAAGDLDASFGSDGRVTTDFGLVAAGDDIAHSVAYQADGKFVVLGETPGSNATILRYNEDGSLDATFGIAGHVNADVIGASFRGSGIAVDNAGRIVVAGTTFTGEEVDIDFAVVRLNSDGTLDTTFSGDGKQTIDFGDTDDICSSVALDSTGRIVLAGFIGQGLSIPASPGHYFGPGIDFAVARLNSDGSLDTTFSGNGKQTIDFDGKQTIDFEGHGERATSVTVDSADRIVVAGYSSTGPDSYSEYAVARLNSDGSLDTTFSDDGKLTFDMVSNDYEVATDVAVDDADRIVVAGSDTWGRFNVARINTDGTFDASFSGDGKQVIDFWSEPLEIWRARLSLDSAGRIVVAGGRHNFAVARLTSDGELDTTFSEDGMQAIDFGSSAEVANSVAVDAADRVLVVGRSQGETSTDFALARLTESGALDAAFNGDGKLLTNLDFFPAEDVATDVAYQSDGKIVVLGLADYRSGVIARYNPDGSLDTAFGTAGKLVLGPEPYFAIAVDSLDRIVVVGHYSLVRLDADGSWDMTFGEEGRQVLDWPFVVTFYGSTGLAVDSTDRIMVSGGLGSYFGVARLNTDGYLDTPFGTNGSRSVESLGGANSVAVDSAGRILISGLSYHGTIGLHFAIVRFNIDGSLDTTFGADGMQTLEFFNAVDSDVNWGPKRGFAQLAVDSADRVVVAGATHQEATGYDFAVARLTSNGQLDASFAAGGWRTIDFGSQFDYANGVAIDGAGRIVVVGSTYQGISENYDSDWEFDFAVVRLNDDGSFDTSFGQGVVDFSTYDIAVGVIIDNAGGIVIVGDSWSADSGSYDIALARLIGDTSGGDADGDGIEDSVDTQPATFSNEFSDIANGGVTTGTITGRGDQILSIADSGNPAEGLLIIADASGGATPASIVVEGTTIFLDAGESIVVTHGSVIVRVLAGDVALVFAAQGGPTVATATLSAGAELKFQPETVTFIAAPTNGEPVQIVLIGDNGQQATATVSSGDQIAFNPGTFKVSAPPTNESPVTIVASTGEIIAANPGTTVHAAVSAVTINIAPESLNLDSNGVLTVLVYGAANFNASQIDVSSVRFAGAAAMQSMLLDANNDGQLDLQLKFHRQDTALLAIYQELLLADEDADGVLDNTRQAAVVSLTGETIDDKLFTGSDDITLFLAGKSLRELLNQLFG